MAGTSTADSESHPNGFSTPCLFYAAGNCRKGAQCMFLHVDPPYGANASRGPAPCKFFLQGTCTAGRDCKFSHDVDAEAVMCTTSAGERMMKPGALKQRCRFFDKGGCAAGKTCPYLHIEPKETTSNGVQTRRAPMASGVQMHVLNSKRTAPAQAAPDPDPDAEEDGDADSQDAGSVSDPDPDAEAEAHGDDVQDMSEFLTKEEELYYYGAPGEFELAPDPDALEGKPSYAQVTGTDALDDGTAFHEEMPAAPRICTFFLQGLCRYGDSCFYSHSLEAAPASADDRERIAVELEASKDLECGICYDNILAKGERFGLLSGCNHAFCLSCVRNWRGTTEQSKQTLRQCPVCRVETHFIIPSNRMVTDPDRKAELILRYKENLASIPCRHFDEGRGTCPFGTSCFYAHRFPDGTLEERQVRTAVDSDGHYDVMQQVRLDHYFQKTEL